MRRRGRCGDGPRASSSPSSSRPTTKRIASTSWRSGSKASSRRTRGTTSRSSSSRTGRSTRTWDKLLAIHERDPRFKILRLARNFRMDGGLTAGLAHAKGDAAVLMTADLQDPPELITQFIAKWEEGYENVYGIVTARHGTGPLRRFNSRHVLLGRGQAHRRSHPAERERLPARRPQGLRDDQHDGGAQPLRPRPVRVGRLQVDRDRASNARRASAACRTRTRSR